MTSKPLVAVPASGGGEPYEVRKFGADKYVLRRTDQNGRNNSLLITTADAIALSNALIDVIEGEP